MKFGKKLKVKINVFEKVWLEKAMELMNMGFSDKQQNMELV